MNIGFVQKKETKIGDNIVKWFEVSIRVPFVSCTLTLTKRKPKEDDKPEVPDFELYFSPNRKGESFDRMKVGSLWKKVSEKGNDYLSGYIESPILPLGKMYISIVSYVHQEGMPVQNIIYNVLWSPQKNNKDSEEYEGSGSDGVNRGEYSSYIPQPQHPKNENSKGYENENSKGYEVVYEDTEVEEDEIPF